MAVMMRSMLEVADNSGARKLQMILPLGGSTGSNAGLGDTITTTVTATEAEMKAKIEDCLGIYRRRTNHGPTAPEFRSELRAATGLHA